MSVLQITFWSLKLSPAKSLSIPTLEDWHFLECFIMNTTNYRVEEEEEVEEEVVTTSQQPDYEQRDYGSAGSGRDDYKSDREDDE